METLNDQTILYPVHQTHFGRDGIHFFLDGEHPNWLATDTRGSDILGLVDGRRTFGEAVGLYATRHRVDGIRAWLHLHDFLSGALRCGMLTRSASPQGDYPGRNQFLKTDRLREFWLHTNNSCNLSCTHCLVSSRPGGDPGQTFEFYRKVIDETHALGVQRYFLTGGEPFLRQDIFEMIRYITVQKEAELIILTNAMLFSSDRLRALEGLDRTRVKFQVSLDGSTPRVNDPIRGPGTFGRILEGLRALNDRGFETSLTAVVLAGNLEDLVHLPGLAQSLGTRSLHLMWPLRRGRLLEDGQDSSSRMLTAGELLQTARAVRQQARHHGIPFDNYEAIQRRANGRPGIRYDLGNACWDSLCLYSDGHLYPSAAFAGVPALDMGAVRDRSVKDLWLESPLARHFRGASVRAQAGINGDPFKYLTGGGDMERAFFDHLARRREADILAEDPHYSMTVELVKDVMWETATQQRAALNHRAGDDVPRIYHAMGEGAVLSSREEDHRPVSTLHSNCVLSFDVEQPRRVIRDFYGKAAQQPQADLCCPVQYDLQETGHIPQEVLDRFYGCGSPILQAVVRPAETLVDLGSGGGIDCFIAARKVGPEGRVIGIDMTDEMLAVARHYRDPVARNLGYQVVEFRRGTLEKIPLEDDFADVITSNCVINLSPDKPRVFSEMWRILKDHGRIVLADIVSEAPLPFHLRANEQLMGECIAGALTEAGFLAALEQAGFYGLSILNKVYWKEIQGHRLYSVTVRGFKYEKKSTGVCQGERVIYRGPFKAVIDEEGHLFVRNEPVEICTDTAARLKHSPYGAEFTICEPDGRAVGPLAGESTNQNDVCTPACC